MSHNVSLTYYSSRTFLIILLILFGFISSRALISIGTALLGLNLILSTKEHRWQFVKKNNFSILAASLFFLVSALFVLIAPDYMVALKQLYYRLPWLLIPISLAALEKPKLAWTHLTLSFFVFLITVSGAVVLLNYFSNYEHYTAQIAMAKNIPTPLNHIRYSLMVAFAGLTSLYFLVKNNTQLTRHDWKFFAITSLFLFALIHILSVRSGLLSYYLGIGFLIIYFTIHYKKYWILPVFGLILFALPLIAYQTLPSFQNKVAYMKYDFQQLKAGNIGHNSDGRRWRSLLMAKDLIASKPILGHGCGQVQMVSNEYYGFHHPEVEEHNRKVPHNQFVYSSVEMGIIGLLFLSVVILAPLFINGWHGSVLYMVLWIVVMSSCLVENTFESQIGMTFYLILGSLLLKQRRDD